METSPYAMPVSEPAAPPSETAAEAIRRAHVDHEHTLRSIPALFVGGILIIPREVGKTMISWIESRNWDVTLVCILVIVPILVISYGVCRFRAWARWMALGLAVLLLIAGILAGAIFLPILFSGATIYYLLSKQSAMIFSPAYREIIAATPHIRYVRPKMPMTRRGRWMLVALWAIASLAFSWYLFSN